MDRAVARYDWSIMQQRTWIRHYLPVLVMCLAAVTGEALTSARAAFEQGTVVVSGAGTRSNMVAGDM